MATLYSLSDGNPVQSLLLRKCLPKVKHFDELGIERFVHDIVNEMIHGDIDKTPYAAFKAEDLKTIFESFKIFITQCINLSLTKEQVYASNCVLVLWVLLVMSLVPWLCVLAPLCFCTCVASSFSL